MSSSSSKEFQVPLAKSSKDKEEWLATLSNCVAKEQLLGFRDSSNRFAKTLFVWFLFQEESSSHRLWQSLSAQLRFKLSHQHDLWIQDVTQKIQRNQVNSVSISLIAFSIVRGIENHANLSLLESMEEIVRYIWTWSESGAHSLFLYGKLHTWLQEFLQIQPVNLSILERWITLLVSLALRFNYLNHWQTMGANKTCWQLLSELQKAPTQFDRKQPTTVLLHRVLTNLSGSKENLSKLVNTLESWTKTHDREAKSPLPSLLSFVRWALLTGVKILSPVHQLYVEDYVACAADKKMIYLPVKSNKRFYTYADNTKNTDTGWQLEKEQEDKMTQMQVERQEILVAFEEVSRFYSVLDQSHFRHLFLGLLALNHVYDSSSVISLLPLSSLDGVQDCVELMFGPSSLLIQTYAHIDAWAKYQCLQSGPVLKLSPQEFYHLDLFFDAMLHGVAKQYCIGMYDTELLERVVSIVVPATIRDSVQLGFRHNIFDFVVQLGVEVLVRVDSRSFYGPQLLKEFSELDLVWPSLFKQPISWTGYWSWRTLKILEPLFSLEPTYLDQPVVWNQLEKGTLTDHKQKCDELSQLQIYGRIQAIQHVLWLGLVPQLKRDNPKWFDERDTAQYTLSLMNLAFISVVNDETKVKKSLEDVAKHHDDKDQSYLSSLLESATHFSVKNCKDLLLSLRHIKNSQFSRLANCIEKIKDPFKDGVLKYEKAVEAVYFVRLLALVCEQDFKETLTPHARFDRHGDVIAVSDPLSHTLEWKLRPFNGCRWQDNPEPLSWGQAALVLKEQRDLFNLQLHLGASFGREPPPNQLKEASRKPLKASGESL